ncbi:MAG: PspC domain-containing protein [Bacteroidales bacterium]|jgi:phage shock protein PspC (stress-responsive transcriptional regulator)|nr:PspC domain-containing protein [Bacteroidales bacterium]
MKKVITIHLNNKVFQIEEEAYVCLSKALANFRDREDQVAEGLEGKISGSKTVITYPDVVDVLYRLGYTFSESPQTPYSAKRLYRQPKDKLIAGVCTGLAEYFNVDPVPIRVVFLIAFLLGSLGFWAYVACWIIVPKSPKLLHA